MSIRCKNKYLYDFRYQCGCSCCKRYECTPQKPVYPSLYDIDTTTSFWDWAIMSSILFMFYSTVVFIAGVVR